MDYVDIDGKVVHINTRQDKLLKLLYTTSFGRLALKPLVQPKVSELMGRFLDTSFSANLVKPFIKQADIDMSDFPPRQYTSFNDFFTRKIKYGKRPIDMDEDSLISPCDSRVTVYPILKNSNFMIKHTEYTLRSLLHSRKLADKYLGGYIYVLRLTVSDYHRYIYAASGRQSKTYRIDGALHTVNPIANDYLPIYKENTREYSIIHTKNLGDIIQMEVGALLVGKITNHGDNKKVSRGDEKGYFEYGGSTIILITEPDKVTPRKDIISNTSNDLETRILQGMQVGHV